MKEPLVELKCVRTFQGHDGIGLNADVWIDGIKCMHVHDGAFGGELEVQPFLYKNPKAELIKAKMALLDKYIATLPKVKSTIDDFEFAMDLDMYINGKLEVIEKQKSLDKFKKKMQKDFLTAICYGSTSRYSTTYWKGRTLASIPLEYLQKAYDEVKAKKLKEGDVILNDNLEALGVKL